jgi:hypothetical protein
LSPPPHFASVFNIHGYPSQDFLHLLAALIKQVVDATTSPILSQMSHVTLDGWLFPYLAIFPYLFSPLSFISCLHCTRNHPQIPPPPSIVIQKQGLCPPPSFRSHGQARERVDRKRIHH